MKQKILLIINLLCCCAFYLNAQQHQYLVGGCGLNKVAIINRQGDILWETKNETSDCNDAEVTKQGHILFAYTKGARLISRDQQIIWDYQINPSEEMFCATQLKSGNFLLACCGNPARVIELSPDGKVVTEFSFDTGIKAVHAQFRQIEKTKKGTYLVPLFGTAVVREINNRGETLREVKVEGTPFQVSVLKNKNWLVACGDAHSLLEVNPENGKIIKRIGQNDLFFCKLHFVAESRRLKNGNTLIANWNGHSGNDNSQPLVVEIDSKNQLVWSLFETPLLKRISTIYPLQ